MLIVLDKAEYFVLQKLTLNLLNWKDTVEN